LLREPPRRRKGTRREQTEGANELTNFLINTVKIMGYKILDAKADIHEDIEAYFMRTHFDEVNVEDILDIVDEHFEKIER
jgi:hypothetical protein